MATPEPEPPPQLAFPAAPPPRASQDNDGNARLYRALRAAAEEDGGALLVALGAQARPADAPLVFQLRRAPRPGVPFYFALRPVAPASAL